MFKRFTYERGPFFLNVVQNVIDGMSAEKTLGYNPDLDSGAMEDICGGSVLNLLSVADKLDLVSASANDDKDAGTGIREVTIVGLDANYEPLTEDIELEGLTPVETQNEFLRVLDVKTKIVGSGGVADGNITISAGGTTLATITAAYNSAQNGAYCVPKNKVGYLIGMWSGIHHATTAGLFGFELKLLTKTQGGVWLEKMNYAHQSTDVCVFPFFVPIPLAEYEDVKLQGRAITNNGLTFAGFDTLLIDKDKITDPKI